MLRIAEFARERGVETVPHAWKSGIIKAASLHVNAVLPDALFQEYCIADTPINTLLTKRAPADRRRRLPRRADRARASASRSTRTWSRATASTRGGRHGDDRQNRGSDLAARAARVIPGGVNSGQRRVPGLEELVIAATSGSTFTDGDGQHLHRLPRRLRAAAARPQRPRRRRRRRGGRADGRADGHRRDADRGRAGRADLRARAVGRARAADRDRQRGDLPRAARRARRDRPPARRSSSRAATTAGTTRSR